jgi:hypothetical protein
MFCIGAWLLYYSVSGAFSGGCCGWWYLRLDWFFVAFLRLFIYVDLTVHQVQAHLPVSFWEDCYSSPAWALPVFCGLFLLYRGLLQAAMVVLCLSAPAFLLFDCGVG